MIFGWFREQSTLTIKFGGRNTRNFQEKTHDVAERNAGRFDADLYCRRNKETPMASFLKKEQAG